MTDSPTLAASRSADECRVGAEREGAASRRSVLRAAGLAALVGGGAATLAGCSSDAATPNPAAGSGPASDAAPSPSAPAPSPAEPAASSAPASSAAAPAGPSVAKADVPEGGGVVLEDADFVVTQPSAGTFKAYNAICTHQGCKVSSVTDGKITCPCHGSAFSIEDGSVANPPANKPLAAATLTESGDTLVILT